MSGERSDDSDILITCLFIFMKSLIPIPWLTFDQGQYHIRINVGGFRKFSRKLKKVCNNSKLCCMCWEKGNKSLAFKIF